MSRIAGRDENPSEFASVPPLGSLGTRRDSIAFTLGQITATLSSVQGTLADMSQKFDRFDVSQNEMGAKIRAIEDKILEAQTKLNSLASVGKGLSNLAAILWTAGAFVVGLAIDHKGWIIRLIAGSHSGS